MKLNLVKLHRRYTLLVYLAKYYPIKLIAYLRAFSLKDKNIVIDINNDEKKIGSINLGFIGHIDENDFECDEIIPFRLKEIAKDVDVFFTYYNSDHMVYNAILETNNICNVFNMNNKVLRINQTKVGVSLYSLEELEKGLVSSLDIALKLRLLKRSKSGFNIAFIIGKDYNTNLSASIKKKIGTFGYDMVVCYDNVLKAKKNYRTLDFKSTRVLYSLGSCANSSGEDIERPSLIYIASLRKNSKKTRLIKEGYIPIELSFNNNKLINLKLLEIEKDKKFNRNFCGYIKRIMIGNRPWEQSITLKDILEIIEEDLPQKYNDLLDCTVNQICARTFELAPGNVFFFRKQFKDNNDIKLESELKRFRLVFKAYLRKSLFIFSYKPLPNFIPHLVINNPTEAHIKTMAWYKDRFVDSEFIGVTGSIGKTSTKDMLSCVLSERFNTEKNIRNSNVQVKIAINLQRIKPNTDIYVQEIGGGRPGGASRHSRMIKPKVAIITNIGTAHIGNYNSKEDLLANKLGITDGMGQDGVLFLNADDELLWKAKPKCKVIYYALKNNNADFYAKNIKVINDVTYFEVQFGDKSTELSINVLGDHNVLNAVCSFAVAKYYNLDDELIRKGLEKYQTEGSRQNIININSYKFYVDCYNASIDSIEKSLDVLEGLVPINKGRKIAVIGDVTGVGHLQNDINNQISKALIEHNIDYIVCYGDEGENIKKQVKAYKEGIISIKKPKELELWLIDNIKKDDIILLKGSSKVKLDQRLDFAFGTDLADIRYIDEAHCSLIKRNNIKYLIFKDYASIKKYLGEEENLVIKNRVIGRKIIKIKEKAFMNSNMKSVEIQEGIVHIGKYAFANCINLEEIKLPLSIRYIDDGAFMNCEKLKNITLNDNIVYIGDSAFEGCKLWFGNDTLVSSRNSD